MKHYITVMPVSQYYYSTDTKNYHIKKSYYNEGIMCM